MSYPMRYALLRARKITASLLSICGVFFLLLIFQPVTEGFYRVVSGVVSPAESASVETLEETGPWQITRTQDRVCIARVPEIKLASEELGTSH